jgi:predicted MPP superfamily phosphohydrolase
VRHALRPNLARLRGTRIVQISDLHVGPYFRADTFAAHIARIRELDPHLVVITGDAMDWSRRYESDYVEPLRRLEARCAVLAILGNHDFYFGARRLSQVYREQTHVRVLRNQVFTTDALPGLHVWGIDDPMTALSQPAAYPFVNEVGPKLDPGGFHVLLSHRPDAFPTAAQAGFDLQLSGHTHGGQISYASVFGRLHVSRVLGPFDRGQFGLQGRRGLSRLYVNRGLGYTAIPYRRDCHTEISLHELI